MAEALRAEAVEVDVSIKDGWVNFDWAMGGRDLTSTIVCNRGIDCSQPEDEHAVLCFLLILVLASVTD